MGKLSKQTDKYFMKALESFKSAAELFSSGQQRQGFEKIAEDIGHLLMAIKSAFSEVLLELNQLETKLDQQELKLDKLEGKLDKLEDEFEKMESKADQMEAKVDKLDNWTNITEVKLDKILGEPIDIVVDTPGPGTGTVRPYRTSERTVAKKKD